LRFNKSEDPLAAQLGGNVSGDLALAAPAIGGQGRQVPQNVDSGLPGQIVHDMFLASNMGI